MTIGGTKMLTLDATNANGNAAGNGITTSGSGTTHTIRAKIGLGASQTWTVGIDTALTVSGAITDFGGGFTLTKAGPSTLTLTGLNTYAGGTVVNSGELIVSGGGFQNTTAVIINAGTLTLGANNMINDAASVTLGAGSTLKTSGFSDTLGTTLTLTGNSTIDFGAGNSSTLIFTTLALGATNTLDIWNWTTTNGTDPDPGFAGDNLRDRLLFSGIAINRLTPGELSRIRFFSDAGGDLLGTAGQIAIGSVTSRGDLYSGHHELVPVPIPEPTTIFGALALLGLVGYRERRRLKSALATRI